MPGLDEGTERHAPMGRAIIGGVITSTLLTPVVVPVTYSYGDAWQGRVFKRRAHAGGAALIAQPADECKQGFSRSAWRIRGPCTDAAT